MQNVPQTERLGIAKLEMIFAENGWLFREQFVKDIGIDAQVEIVEKNVSTGELIAIQVKTGESYFKETDGKHIVYRVNKKHYTYWLKHSLPVVIVLYNPKTDLVIWCPIVNDNWEELEDSYKIKISIEQTLESKNCMVLKKVLKLPLQTFRLHKLILDHSLIEKVNEGNEVCVEYDDWINKSLSRIEVRIYINVNGEWEEHKIPMTYCAGLTSHQILEKILPWADFEMDIDAYEERKREEYENEAYAYYDKEDGVKYYSETFDEWYEEPKSFQPIYSDGEIETYRLIVKLNDLGSAFLTVANYLFDKSKFEIRSFTIDDII